jgi:hypothetical protein
MLGFPSKGANVSRGFKAAIPRPKPKASEVMIRVLGAAAFVGESQAERPKVTIAAYGESIQDERR